MTLATGTTDRGESAGKGVNFGAYAIVKNRAKHASIFENGSEVRQVLRKPSGRAGNFGLSRGRMPPGRVFVPIIIRKRNAMNERLKILLRDNGFQVT
jgi:hypothetical protein